MVELDPHARDATRRHDHRSPGAHVLLNIGNPDTGREAHICAIEQDRCAFAAAMRLGAVFGGLPREQEDARTASGPNLGYAFQITDDLPGLRLRCRYARRTSATTRRSKLRPPLLIYAIARSTPEQAVSLKRALKSAGLIRSTTSKVRDRALEATYAKVRALRTRRENLPAPAADVESGEALVALAGYGWIG